VTDSAHAPTLPPAPAAGTSGRSGSQEIRPGLTLQWSENALPAAPAGTAVCLLYQLSPPPGRMSLHRGVPACDCAAAAGEFRAALTLTPAAVQDLLAGEATAGAGRLHRFAGPDEGGDEHPLTPLARLALESIRRCPFAGACRCMALAARGHDLLVEFLAALAEPARPGAAVVGSSDRIRLAAEILQSDLEHPPSLAELAARAGLSETTLKRGFHQVFGTTVYGYVRARRMEQAHRLLETGAATVLEAATLVGYSNPSNFSAAFRRQFGVNPKTFQLRARHLG